MAGRNLFATDTAKGRNLFAEQEPKEKGIFGDLTIEETAGYDPFTVENILGAAVEPMMTIGSGGAGLVTSGLAGLGAMGSRALGFDTGDPADVVRATQEAMTYQPRTRGGQTVMEGLGEALSDIPEVAEWEAQRSGSPAEAALKQTMVEGIPMLLGARAAPSGIPFSPKINRVISAPSRGVSKVSGALAKAGKNIFPVHTERAGRFLNELAGPDREAVIAAMENARLGETAGQAATPVGRSEFLAMEKLMGTREPTEFAPTGRVREAQQAERAGEMARVGGTPEELAAAIQERKKVTKPMYKEARTGEIQGASDVITKVDTLIKQNPGNTRLLAELRRVKRGLTDEKGVPRADAQEVLSTINGIKAALAEQKDPFIKKTLTDIKDSITGLSETYKGAEESYRIMSKPVNEMQTLQSLNKVLEPRLGTKERVMAFANALENAKKLVKKETRREAELKDILTEEQLKVVDKAREQLDRDMTLKEKASEGYKKLNKILGDELAPPEAPGMLSSKVMIFRNMMKRLKGVANENTLKLLDENWDKPKEIAKLMRDASPKSQAIIQEYLNTRNQLLTGSAIGAAESE